MHTLTYETLESIIIKRPVNRLDYFAHCCTDKFVMDIGSYDETAYNLKRSSKYWLFGRLEKVARSLMGVDNAISESEMTYKSAKIIKMSATDIGKLGLSNLEILSAGELIEHLEAPLQFLKDLKANYSGKELLISTPNGTSIANFLMALIKKEAQHKDHLHVFTFKTLNTMFSKAGFNKWEIIPGYFAATELKMQAKPGLKRNFIVLVEKIIQVLEWLFPLTSSTLIAHIEI